MGAPSEWSQRNGGGVLLRLGMLELTVSRSDVLSREVAGALKYIYSYLAIFCRVVFRC